MPPPSTLDAVAREAAHQMLARRVEAVLSGSEAPPYVRIDQPVAAASPLAWLAAQTAWPRMYWHAREGDTRTAALGAARTVRGDTPDLAPLQRVLESLGPDARFYGGLRFDSERPPDGTWSLDDAWRFTLPRVTYTLDADDAATLSVHLCPAHDRSRRAEIVRSIRSLALPVALEAMTLPLPLSRDDQPDEEGWKREVEAALAAFDRDALGKVVLARRVTFEFPTALDPYALLHRLEAATPACFHFLTEHTEHAAFVGASPERLFSLRGGRVESEAIAGTRPRAASRTRDAALRDELLGSDKDLREHGFVRAFLRETFAPFLGTLDLDAAPQEMPLSRGRHLRSHVSGTTHAGVSPLDLLRALHPTPAVGGTPTPAALAFIRRAEAFDRGRYAAPVGWVSRDAAEFAVGIRSGRVEGTTLALYSGAGLVEGSEAHSEWQEIEGKIADFVAVLGLDAR